MEIQDKEAIPLTIIPRTFKPVSDYCQCNIASFQKKDYKQTMNDPIIAQKGPFVQKLEPGSYWWCACGRSKTQPFCDGSHKGTSFAPRKVDLTEPKTVAFCGCKHSKNGAFCDGTHGGLK